MQRKGAGQPRAVNEDKDRPSQMLPGSGRFACRASVNPYCRLVWQVAPFSRRETEVQRG